MSSLGRGVLLAMVPLNVVLLLWVWLGRALVDAAGWWMVIGFVALPFLAAGLGVTTVLGFRGAGTPRALTDSQAVAHLAVWAGMLAFGFFLVDFTDSPDRVPA